MSGEVFTAPGDLGSQNCYLIGTRKWKIYQPYAPAAFTPREISVVLISVRGLTITPTAWQNLYFNEQITIVGLSGIIPQI